MWLRKRGLDPATALAGLPTSVPLLREFVQESFDEGKVSLRAVNHAIQGATDVHWHLQEG